MREGLFALYSIIGLGYVGYNIFGRLSLNPQDQPYNSLFDQRIYIRHLTISMILTAIGFLITANYDNRAVMLMIPTTFLLLLWTCNAIFRRKLGRNIMLAAGHDKSDIEIKFVDRLSLFIILFLSIIIPGLVMNLFRGES